MADKSGIYRRLGTATRVMNSEIKKEIIRQDAIDTGRMRNISKVVVLNWDENKTSIEVEIKSTFYYKFVDERKAKKWKNGKIKRNITKAFMKREKVLDQLGKLAIEILNYQVNKQFQ